jgi:hypothetical protein
MTVQLDRVNPQFRQLTDLLFFSDRVDLDLSEFKSLLKENYVDHHAYMWDRLQKCIEIFWENGEQFWSNRFAFLLSLNEKVLSKNLEELLEKRMFDLVRTKSQVNILYDIQYLQYVEYCKLRLKSDKEYLGGIKDYLTDLPSHSSVEKLVTIVNSFTPFVFASLNDYAAQLARKITQSTRNFEFLLALEEKALENFFLDREPITKLAQDILSDRVLNDKNIRTFFSLISDVKIMSSLKREYHSSMRPRLVALLESCEYTTIEEHHLRNVKNILELDASLADDIVDIYADKLYNRGSGHKKANADRLIRLAKTFPQISPRKILSFLSSNNKMNDIRYVISAFPDLKKLAAFV